MLHIKFQASGQSGSEEEKFLKYFSMYSYGYKQGPYGGAILDPAALI